MIERRWWMLIVLLIQSLALRRRSTLTTNITVALHPGTRAC